MSVRLKRPKPKAIGGASAAIAASGSKETFTKSGSISVAELVDKTPILPRPFFNPPDVNALAKYDASLNMALYQILIKLAFRLNNALVKDGTEAMSGPFATTSATATIASGAITATSSYMIVDTESAGATDDLDTINGGVDGFRLTLRAANSARTVVVKDGATIEGPGDVTLDNEEDTVSLIYDGTLAKWLVTASSNNGA